MTRWLNRLPNWLRAGVATTFFVAVPGFLLSLAGWLGESTTDEIAGNRKVMVGVLISTLSVAIAIVAQVLIMRGGA